MDYLPHRTPLGLLLFSLILQHVCACVCACLCVHVYVCINLNPNDRDTGSLKTANKVFFYGGHRQAI